MSSFSIGISLQLITGAVSKLSVSAQFLSLKIMNRHVTIEWYYYNSDNRNGIMKCFLRDISVIYPKEGVCNE